MIGGTDAGLYFRLSDNLGSTSLVAKADGTEQPNSRVVYAPFGEIRSGQQSTLTDFGYTGQRHDDADGLMYYGARYYLPSIQHFISADTMTSGISASQSLNRYAYVSNNPIKHTDPTGHMQAGGGGFFDHGDLNTDTDCAQLPDSSACTPKTPQGTGSGDKNNTSDAPTPTADPGTNNPLLNNKKSAQQSSMAAAGMVGTLTLAGGGLPEELALPAIGLSSAVVLPLAAAGVIIVVTVVLVTTPGSQQQPSISVTIVMPGDPFANVFPATKVGKLQGEISKGQAPSGVTGAHKGRAGAEVEQDHVHVNGGAINEDGTWKHKPNGSLTNKQKDWLDKHGWPSNDHPDYVNK